MTYLEYLSERKLTLIMSLPKNDPEVCAAAFEAGADVVKVHINVEHRASGTNFGRLAEEGPAFREMFSAAKGPMGLVPGKSPEKIQADLEMLEDFPFAFYSVYAHHAPAALLRTDRLIMGACDGTYTEPEISAMKDCGASILESSIVPGEKYGSPLTMRDLLRYRAIVRQTDLPVVVPTQKAIQPSDVPNLMKTGIKGLMIGAIVTGKTKASIVDAIRAFREAIDAC